MNEKIVSAYENAKSVYAEIGVDTDRAIEAVSRVPVSVHCWQGDDVLGFIKDNDTLGGGIQTTGNYPGRARNAEELRKDLDVAFSLIPGKQRLNIHAIHADTDEKVDLDALEPRHFASWVDYCKEKDIALDYNPSCFAHPMADSGFTLSSADPAIRDFWLAHCIGSRK
ncbi:MAG: L-rhamnose isomerase, partial [Clostridia bacterium]|nr:L-rhamnose isomerase [Clostridia bacterium]